MELLRDISEELKSSYIDYAMSVIVGRALPDVRDGLKPVQRRILYAMYEMGLLSNRPYRKSARIVGEVLGKYHPHGDTAVYDALVRLAQDFSMRYPLIDGQGNFGSIDGDSPAAMRYTEARLAKIAEEMLADIERNTVDFMPNFDSTLQEPEVLPAKIPNLLINGSSGIAVGMATNIPPHNLSEVCDAVVAFIRNPEISVDGLMRYITAPDFPTGGIIVGREGIAEAYRTGKGKIIVRGRVDVEGNSLIVREVPYMVNKAKLVESIAELAKDRIDEIRTIRDESDREGIRVVIELKSGSNPELVLKKLYAYSNLQTTFGVILLALVDKEPRILNLREIIALYVDHRRNVVRRRVTFDLEKARERLHIVEGLKVVVEDIDNAVGLIRSSPSPSEAKKRLMERYSLSSKQADAVLQMRLQKLTAIEIDALMAEYEELKSKIAEYESILADPKKIDDIIVREVLEIKEKYGDERRTEIAIQQDEIAAEDLIEEEENIVLITSEGFAKRMSLEEFRLQARGGVGVIGTALGREDSISVFRICKSTDHLLLFTNTGRVFWINAYEIPKMDRTSRGTSLRKFIRLENGERVVSAIGVDSFDEKSVAILSSDGYIKRVSVSEFENAKRAGIRASSGDIAFAELVEDESVVIATSNGNVVRLKASAIPEYGRNAKGVIAVRLREGDSVSSMSTSKGEYLLILTEKGYGKRCHIDEFRFIGRGSMGMIGYRVSGKTGKVVFAELCSGGEAFIISPDGYCIRVDISTIPVQGRYSSGVVVARKGVAAVALKKLYKNAF
ncbi:DNA gyrase subunit A [Archaeoglobus neptunius]|uniref:DNA gyrase subunit A n=1 Tax=Archaeoglobus neptunius TaxID=2798580 RepID=UPI0019254419|nr:DNA gyrase subunit A [Archaeoglobus neptunius]